MASKPDKPPLKVASVRGRTPVTKSLNSTSSTASTRAKQAAGPIVKPAATVNEKKHQRTPVASSVMSSKTEKPVAPGKSTRAPSSSRTPAAAGDTKPRVNGNKSNPPSVAKSATPTPSSSVKSLPPPQTLPPPIEQQVPKGTSDPLQVASQVYPWMYMTSTLEACFQTAEETAQKDMEVRSKQLEEEESSIANQRIRFEAERAADFYDELANDTFAKEAPSIMQTFLSHGDACTRLEAEALQLATQGASEPDDDAPLQIYNEMLDSLETLHAEAVGLETSILRLTSHADQDSSRDDTADSTARSQILGVFSACLPVLRARISNLTMAQDLIDGAQENLSIGLRMESLGLLD